MNPIKFLLDGNVGKCIRNFLVRKGYDVQTIIDLNPRMLDEEILLLAYQEDRVIITADKDFGN